jgi:phosphate transport system substrate-binding protein
MPLLSAHLVSLNLRRAVHLIGAVAATVIACASASAEAPAAAQPRAGYVQTDGSMQIVGQRDFEGIIGSLNRIFSPAHPDAKFNYAPGNDLSAFYSLIFDAAALAPVGQEFPGSSATAYRIIVGADPFGIRLAHASLKPAAKLSPVAVIVHPSNPVSHLSVGQVTHLFTTGGRKPDLTHWGQVGAPQEWAALPIHLTGLPPSEHFPSDDLSFGDFMFLHQFGGAPAAPNYEAVRSYDEVVARVARDPQMIGLTALNRVTSAVKVVAIGDGWAEPSAASSQDLEAGVYPFDRYVYLYVRRKPGKPLDPWIRDYLRLALSPAGQAAIAASGLGYGPLNPREIAKELFKLR